MQRGVPHAERNSRNRAEEREEEKVGGGEKKRKRKYIKKMLNCERIALFFSFNKLNQFLHVEPQD